MPLRLTIDEELLRQAMAIGRHRTRSETVNEALREFVERRHRLELVGLVGKVAYDPRYDYKAERRAR